MADQGKGQKKASIAFVIVGFVAVVLLSLQSIFLHRDIQAIKNRIQTNAGIAGVRTRRSVNSECITIEECKRHAMREIRGRLSQVEHMPSVHFGMAISRTGLTRPRSGTDSGQILAWTSDTPIGHNRLGSLLSASGQREVRVPMSGVYMVYAQITYNGLNRRRRYSVHPCTFVIERLIGNHSEALAYGMTTQYKLGRPFSVSDSGNDIRAFDSVHTSGFFVLEVGDSLRVRLPNHSAHCIGLHQPEKTFFGFSMVSRG